MSLSSKTVLAQILEWCPIQMSPKLVLLAWQTLETQFWNFYTPVDIVRFFCPPRKYPIKQKVFNTDMLFKIQTKKTTTQAAHSSIIIHPNPVLQNVFNT